MPDKLRELVFETMKELNNKTEMIVFLDETGEVIGGVGKYDKEFKKLGGCKNCFDGQKKLHKLTSIALAKVTSSPGHYIVCGKELCWVPGK